MRIGYVWRAMLQSPVVVITGFHRFTGIIYASNGFRISLTFTYDIRRDYWHTRTLTLYRVELVVFFNVMAVWKRFDWGEMSASGFEFFA